MPRGFVSASTITVKSTIWSQPLAVISEALRSQERVHEIYQHAHHDDRGDARFERHACSDGASDAPSFAHAAMYASMSAKNAIVPITYNRSYILPLLLRPVCIGRWWRVSGRALT